jgi:S1-C subfamily serine protease
VRFFGSRYPVNGDILLAVDGQEITTEQDLWAAIDRRKAGEKVSFRVLRGGQNVEVPVVLQEAPAPARR